MPIQSHKRTQICHNKILYNYTSSNSNTKKEKNLFQGKLMFANPYEMKIFTKTDFSSFAGVASLDHNWT